MGKQRDGKPEQATNLTGGPSGQGPESTNALSPTLTIQSTHGNHTTRKTAHRPTTRSPPSSAHAPVTPDHRTARRPAINHNLGTARRLASTVTCLGTNAGSTPNTTRRPETQHIKSNITHQATHHSILTPIHHINLSPSHINKSKGHIKLPSSQIVVAVMPRSS